MVVGHHGQDGKSAAQAVIEEYRLANVHVIDPSQSMVVTLVKGETLIKDRAI